MKFGCFHEKVVRSYTRQILKGLYYLHSNMVLHRDIKGGNILVSDKGQVKLADFGCSKKIQLESTGSKSLIGTALWMAPEVIHSAQYGVAADIWSVGCTVIEMATGWAPWTQDHRFESELQAMYFIAQSTACPRVPAHLSTHAKVFLRRSLARDPGSRPGSEQLLLHPFITEDCVDLADIGKSPPQSAASSLSVEPGGSVPPPLAIDSGLVAGGAAHPAPSDPATSGGSGGAEPPPRREDTGGSGGGSADGGDGIGNGGVARVLSRSLSWQNVTRARAPQPGEPDPPPVLPPPALAVDESPVSVEPAGVDDAPQHVEPQPPQLLAVAPGGQRTFQRT